MSGAKTSLPPEINELLTKDVVWEAALSQDGYGQNTFALPVTKTCWIEQRSFTEGFEIRRGAQSWPIVPTLTLYFDGDDPDARSMTVSDRFTLDDYPTSQTIQPVDVTPFFGPDFDNHNPWLIVVILALE